jgi:sedoheptulokinase
MMPGSMLQEAGIKSVIGSGSALSRNPILQQEFMERFKLETIVGKGGDAAHGAALAVMKNL